MMVTANVPPYFLGLIHLGDGEDVVIAPPWTPHDS